MSYAEKLDAAQRELRKAANVSSDDFRRWPEDKKRRHRIRRALHELLDHHTYPAYRIGVKDGRLTVGPKEAITPEARSWITNNRDDLILWCIEHTGDNRYQEEDEGNV